MSRVKLPGKKPPRGTDEVQQYLSSLSARQQFMASAGNLGWRLAVAVLVPIIIGVKLDDHYKTSPSYTLVGFMIAVTVSSITVWNTVKQVNQDSQKSEDQK